MHRREVCELLAASAAGLTITGCESGQVASRAPGPCVLNQAQTHSRCS
jgi:hypothetical protein